MANKKLFYFCEIYGVHYNKYNELFSLYLIIFNNMNSI